MHIFNFCKSFITIDHPWSATLNRSSLEIAAQILGIAPMKGIEYQENQELIMTAWSVSSEKHNLGMPALCSMECDDCLQHTLMIRFKLVSINIFANCKRYKLHYAILEWPKHISFNTVGVYTYLDLLDYQD